MHIEKIQPTSENLERMQQFTYRQGSDGQTARFARLAQLLLPAALILFLVMIRIVAARAQNIPVLFSLLPQAVIPVPQDTPYPGTMALVVDATDTERGIFRVRERIPAQSGPMVLLYPKWVPGYHGPVGPIDKLAGLRIWCGSTKIPWTRDMTDVYAFHINVPRDAKALDVEFQFLSPADPEEGRIVMSKNILNIEWNTVVLYPAGYFTQRIFVQAGVKLPAGWQFATALASAGEKAGVANFERVPLNTLIDSPLIAGRYFKRLDLDPGGRVAVRMDVFADEPADLTIGAAQRGAYRRLVQQAGKVFGSNHYDHYDFLVSLSDRLGGLGLEHHRSSEDSLSARYFADWNNSLSGRALLPHEYVHSWNGKFRRPADLRTPNFNVPMGDSLLWMYEGQTQFWGDVLAARSGLWTRQQALDAIALNAAFLDHSSGRQWRSLEDTTTNPIFMTQRPLPWQSWQRGEDYYAEGELIWLDADTLIRENTGDKKSLDDFARAFFGMAGGSYSTLTYTFQDIVAVLNEVLRYDWAGFLNARINAIAPTPLDGLKRGGYQLIYADKPSKFLEASEKSNKIADYYYSLGLIVNDRDGRVMAVLWDGPGFNAGLTVGTTIIAVNGISYDSDRLKDAIKNARLSKAPIQLLTKRGEQYSTTPINYHGGLRYPHLERIPGARPLLDELLSPR
jgi:predicted metalloprotease with PDZ domain